MHQLYATLFGICSSLIVEETLSQLSDGELNSTVSASVTCSQYLTKIICILFARGIQIYRKKCFFYSSYIHCKTIET
ncbi:hypothetical protein HanRHA438_Chr05g0221331 [Helianthus annuus]|nr:hypothetical protein HanRHA438_Chr05g0221331 [Helianthus annuus]